MSTAGNYGKVCEYCLTRPYKRESSCDTCDFHMRRLRESAAIAIMAAIVSDPSVEHDIPAEEAAECAIADAEAIINAIKGAAI